MSLIYDFQLLFPSTSAAKFIMSPSCELRCLKAGFKVHLVIAVATPTKCPGVIAELWLRHGTVAEKGHSILPSCHPAILPSCHSSILPFCHPAILLFFHSAILPFILCACAIMHTCYHAHAQLCTRRLRCGCKSLVASCFVVVRCLLKRAASGETQEERHSC